MGRGLVNFFAGMVVGLIGWLMIERVMDRAQLGVTEVAIGVESSTTMIIDTLWQDSVVYKDRWRARVDTCWLPSVNKDTVIVVDSVNVLVPIDKYIFTDDTSYVAELSGYNVTMDRIELYNRTIQNNTTIHHTPKIRHKPWGLGVQAGYGVTIDGRPQPYIGVGVSYNLIRF